MPEDEERRGCEITEAMIARRAFELSLTDDRSTPAENWKRAERQLREEAKAAGASRWRR